MACSYVCVTLQRALIPAVLVIAALIRPTGISFVYLLMLFVSPYVPVATIGNFKGSVVAYLIILIALTSIISLCHIGLIVTELCLTVKTTFTECTFLVQILRHVGFIGIKNLNPTKVFLWMLPEILTLTVSLTIYITFKRLTPNLLSEVESGEIDAALKSQQTSDVNLRNRKSDETTAQRKTGGQSEFSNEIPDFTRLISISPVFCLAALFFAACFRPSVPGGLYFIVFLAAGTFWACSHSLRRKFASCLRCVIVVLALHGVVIVAYQTPWLQEHLPRSSLLARLLCLEPLVISSCENDIRLLNYNKEYGADSFLSPVAVFVAYYILALSSKNLSKIPDNVKPVKQGNSSQNTQEHLSVVAQSTRSIKRENTWNNLHQTNLIPAKHLRNYSIQRISKTTAQNFDNDVDLEPINRSSPPRNEDAEATVFYQVSYAFTSVGGFIYQNSYIFTNVLMMVWSIVYHSWLTFVLLIWANILWMVPNQRKAMLRSSVLIVIYAEILVISQYIYGMDLTGKELPVEHSAGDINLQQIGFDRPQKEGILPFVPLIVKTLFLLMFWITMRQYFKEKVYRRQANTLTDVFVTIHLAVRGRTGENYRLQSRKTSKLMEYIGTTIKYFIVRLWIWIMLMVIFICAMSSSHITGFRICYMALFLFFLWVLQTSSTVWIRIMYGFWLFLIFYAMFILIIIYTYQFDKFDQYWMNFLTLSPSMQADIGLHRYETKDLFLHLLPPTVIVILTVLQVHYFHKQLVVGTSNQPMLVKVDKTRSKSKGEVRNSLLYMLYKKSLSKSTVFLKTFKDVGWRMMDIHYIKIVYIMAFICAAKEQSILNIPLYIFALIGCLLKTSWKLATMRIMSLIVALIVLTKMIYQVAFVDHVQYNVYCDKTDTVHNNALWFGLSKTTKRVTLVKLLKPYIIYMIVATLQALITMRQKRWHHLLGVENKYRFKVPFPEIKREDAEVNLKGLLKYLANYGFYKFGYEISLIALVSTMTYRRDIIAISYTVWLILLILLRRRKSARVWIIFQIYIFISLLLQYIFLVGVPPSFCFIYPWDKSTYAGAIQGWSMLPGQLYFDHSNKLIIEFLLLIIVNRQRRVYKIESTPNFPGGSNNSVVNDIKNLKNNLDFVNPTHDFLSHMRNYLDVFKHAVFCSFYWVTLAVIFLAGTQISDFLGIAYLVGAFVFLWEGSDFYLRPINSILNRWRLLLAFNVANIVIKTWLQMGACLYMEILRKHTCWLVHILGINCALSQEATDSTQTVDNVNRCPSTTFQSILLWDAICFAFLIFQHRIFCSHYFCHIIRDTDANNTLTTRGAEIIESFRQKQIEKRHLHEQQILQKIKKKMEKIRATQQKMQQSTEKITFVDDHGNTITKYTKARSIKTHYHAIRAGDYYMFEDVDEKFELDIISDTGDLLENDSENITETEMKMNRRKTLQDDGQKSKVQVNSAIRQESKEHSSAKTDTQLDVDDDGDDSSIDFDSNPIIRLLESYLVSLTIRLYRFSRNYRYVNKILQAEKKALKHSKGSYVYRETIANVETMSDIMLQEKSSELTQVSAKIPEGTQTTPELESESTEEVEVDFKTPDDASPSDDVNNHNREDSSKNKSLVTRSRDFGFEEDDFTTRDHHIIIELLISAWYAILSNTDLICYIWIFIHQVMHSSLLSLPLPLMVFLWGTLSIPRPSKTFWVTLLAYTQAGVLIKCVFQFKLIWANYTNTLPNNPLSIEKLFGVQMNPHYATYDLILLLLLFFHRYMLKSHGLWKTNKSEHFNKKFDKAVRATNVSVDDLTYAGGDSSKLYRQSNAKPGRNRYVMAFINFFTNMVHKARLPVDVYALMFFCDFINFFVLLFGFNAFSHKHSEDGRNVSVQDYLAENKVPVPFLIMLLVQFSLIVIDRALYLRKAIVAKIIFHFISVIGIHIWMFFIVPYVTGRRFHDSAPPVIFYIMKCFYLLLSAFQIRCGYPQRISGNFLTKSFSAINMVAFKVYLLIPFLYELRTILDWLCTDTTFSLFEWLKMEDIFANVYLVKCFRQMENDFPVARGTKKELYLKILLGGTFILIIVALIWGPLALFALYNTVGQSNTPIEVNVQIHIGTYDSIYTATVRDNFHVFNKDEYNEFKSLYLKYPSATEFLKAYDPGDITVVKLNKHSSTTWDISPPDKLRLVQSLKDKNTDLSIRFTYTITRKPPSKVESRDVRSEITFHLRNNTTLRADLIKMLEDNQTSNHVLIPQLMPKFIKVVNTGEPSYVPMLLNGERLRGLKLTLNKNSDPNKWWEIADECGDDQITIFLKKVPHFNCADGVIFYTFNDKKFPQTLTFLTAGGIIGLYTTFVLVCSRVIKRFSEGYMKRIMYEDLPYIDRVLQLCLDVYLVREAKEFFLEEDLFAKLLFLYRSPETLIQWTRRGDEIEDNEEEFPTSRSNVRRIDN